jgi:hypothetical protein
MTAIQETTLGAELYEPARDLLAAGFTLWIYKSERPNLTLSWMIAEKDGKVATIEYGLFDGYSVTMPIHPSREYGSGLLVWGGRDDYARSMGTLLDAVNVATSGEPFVNFANDGHGTKRSGNTVYRPLPNDGMKHYDWAKDRLVQITSAVFA